MRSDNELSNKAGKPEVRYQGMPIEHLDDDPPKGSNGSPADQLSRPSIKYRGTPVPTEGTPVKSNGGRAPKGKAIGPGKPMTIEIEDVWLGSLFDGTRDVLILSRVKDPRDHPAGVQALNWYREGMQPHRFLPVTAGEGSKVVYYSSAVDARELDVSISIATDHAFDPAVAKKWVETATGAAGLPAFLGGGPQGAAIVTAVGSGLNIGVDLIDNLLDGDPVNMGWQMNIDALREENFEGGWVLLTPDHMKVTISEFLWHKEAAEVELEIDGKDYVVDENGKLLWRDTRARVEEDWPYALLKIDGTPDDKLKKWKAMELTAELTTRFLSADRGPLHTDVTEAFSAFNDVRLTREIAELDKKLKAKGLTAAKKKQLQAERTSAIDNLQDDGLRALVRPEEKKTTTK